MVVDAIAYGPGMVTLATEGQAVTERYTLDIDAGTEAKLRAAFPAGAFTRLTDADCFSDAYEIALPDGTVCLVYVYEWRSRYSYEPAICRPSGERQRMNGHASLDDALQALCASLEAPQALARPAST
jgi:hypothetical protein